MRVQFSWQRKKEKVLRKLFFKKINSKKEIRQERVNNMLDIKFVRNNPEVVKQNIKNKFQDEKLPLVDEVIELDRETEKSNRK